MKYKIRFIANPVSGAKKYHNLKREISALIDHNIYDMEYCETEYAGHAIKLSKEAVLLDYDTVVAIGGDGSVNEVASALVHTKTNLAIIAAGSGNGFATDIGIERNNLSQAIQIINNRKSKIIDSCKVNDKFFINVSGIGFDGKISYQVKNGKKRGLLMYLQHSIMESISYQPIFLDILADGKNISGKFATVSLANGSIYGYNFSIAPHADLKDGLFDLVMIKKAPKIAYFLYAFRFLNKTIHKTPFVEIIKAKEVKINFRDKNVYYHVDGEGYKSSDPLHYIMQPLSIRLFYPI